MSSDGDIGGYIIRVVVEWNQAMSEIKNEGRSIAIRACLVEPLRTVNTKESEKHWRTEIIPAGETPGTLVYLSKVANTMGMDVVGSSKNVA